MLWQNRILNLHKICEVNVSVTHFRVRFNHVIIVDFVTSKRYNKMLRHNKT